MFVITYGESFPIAVVETKEKAEEFIKDLESKQNHTTKYLNIHYGTTLQFKEVEKVD